jgi:hypothetical protein
MHRFISECVCGANASVIRVRRFRFRRGQSGFAAPQRSVRGWFGCASSAFGHGPANPCGIFDMPCPYWRNGNGEENDVALCRKDRRPSCGVTLAQAEAYATERRFPHFLNFHSEKTFRSS